MQKKDALIILSPGFPSGEADTSCLPPIQEFCRLAQKHQPDLQVVVIAFQYPFKKSAYTWHGIEVFAMGGGNRKKIARLLTWLRVYLQLRKLARKYNLKGLLSLWLTETAMVARRFAKSNSIKHVVWLQGQDAKKENNYVFRSGVEEKELVAISQFNREELFRNHGLRAFMIAPNGVNAATFPALNTGQRDIDLLAVGSLIPLKNYEAFVRIIHDLKKDHPHIQAVLAGAGPEERNLSDLAFRLGLHHSLKLVGSLPHPEILKLMNRSKVLLHTSSYEGMSTVLLEALYSGCRVISYQGLGKEPVENLTICATEPEMMAAAQSALNEHAPTRRVLVHDMRDTVSDILNLFR